MSITLRGRPLRFNLKWLRPPPVPPDGTMTLFEHLKELRYRLVVASLAIFVGTVIAFVFNKLLFKLLVLPYKRAIELAQQSRPDIKADLIIQGVAAPFTISLKLAFVAGLVVSSPIWLYQIWAFIVPGLLAKEKRWTLAIVGAATPLFVAGVALGYYVMPKGIAVLINFTPDSTISNLQDLGDFMNFMTRLMVIFGLAFEVPLFILMLNIVGVLPAKHISKYRSYIIFGVFVFAAIATPTPDAITMLLLAVPMVVLVVVSEVLAHLFDRRKARRTAAGADAAAALSNDKALATLSEPDPATDAIEPGSPEPAGQLDAGQLDSGQLGSGQLETGTARPALNGSAPPAVTDEPPMTNGYHPDSSAQALREAVGRLPSASSAPPDGTTVGGGDAPSDATQPGTSASPDVTEPGSPAAPETVHDDLR